MDKGMGRHRRRRRGWASRARWAIGAVLAAIGGVRPSLTSRQVPPAKEKRVSVRGEVRPVSAPLPTGREPEWVRRYDRARREHAGRARQLYAGGDATVSPVAPTALPEPGWCVDEDGVRGVRPYLVAHEQRVRARSSAGAWSHRGVYPPETSTTAGGAQAPGVWDELAVLVRQWEALQRPVA